MKSASFGTAPRLLVSIMLSIVTTVARSSDGLIVHEWGTFTSFQDETGRAIGGLNTNDEPVPSFVHSFANQLMPRSELPMGHFSKGITSRALRDVTMRLETPVMYFHCDRDFHGKVDVQVQFKGGWLSQFYPTALPVAPGANASGVGTLRADTVGSLTWNQLEINSDGKLPKTEERVWLAPRAVDAAQVRATSGEAEKYLFYRGVGHLDSPLKVVRQGEFLQIVSVPSESSTEIKKCWYLDVRRDGSAAFRMLRKAADETTVLARTPAAFQNTDYSATAIAALKTELRRDLIQDGLAGDEADALLNTWELSYFKSVGSRVFFLVPQAWTDRVLPLSISGVSSAIQRVMVGRIELVTPEQRTLLKKIGDGPSPEWERDFFPLFVKSMKNPENSAHMAALMNGNKSLKDVGIQPPALWQAYVDLGRFRNALILDEQQRHPTKDLNLFIANFDLRGYNGRSE